MSFGNYYGTHGRRYPRRPAGGPARTYPAHYPGICPACGVPYLAGTSVLLNVEGQDGRRSGRGHVDAKACGEASRGFRLVGSCGEVAAWERVEVLVDPLTCAARETVTGLILVAGRVSVIEPDEAGAFQDGGIVEALRSGGLQGKRPEERLFRADRVSTCKDCKGLITVGDWLLWERGKGSRHAVAASCVPGLWAVRKVRGVGMVWAGPSGRVLVASWEGSQRNGFRRDFRDATPEEVLAFGSFKGADVGGLDWVFKDIDAEARAENAGFLVQGLPPGSAPDGSI